MGSGDVEELLPALAPPEPERATAAERHEQLDYLEAAALRVGLWVHEDRQAVHLVIALQYHHVADKATYTDQQREVS